MTIYLFMYAFIIIIPVLAWQKEKNIKPFKPLEYRKKNEIFIMFGVIILMMSLRHPSMGWDLGYGTGNGYLEWFTNIAGYSWQELFDTGGILNYEWGYTIFNKLISYISLDQQWLLAACALLSLVPVAILIRDNSRDELFSALVYLGLPSFMIIYSGLRQGIAIGICCYAFKYIKEKKLIKFALIVVLAALFHSSAIVFLCAYPIFKFKATRRIRCLALLFVPIVFALRVPLFQIFSKLFKDEATVDENGAITLFLVFLCIYIFCSLFVDYNDDLTNGFLNLFYVAVICMCFSGIYQTAMRVGYYFMIALVIVLPNVVSTIRDNGTRIKSKLFIEALFLFYGLYAIYTSTWAVAYPYHFFWEVL